MERIMAGGAFKICDDRDFADGFILSISFNKKRQIIYPDLLAGSFVIIHLRKPPGPGAVPSGIRKGGVFF